MSQGNASTAATIKAESLVDTPSTRSLTSPVQPMPGSLRKQSQVLLLDSLYTKGGPDRERRTICVLKNETALCGRSKHKVAGVVAGPKKCTLRLGEDVIASLEVAFDSLPAAFGSTTPGASAASRSARGLRRRTRRSRCGPCPCPCRPPLSTRRRTFPTGSPFASTTSKWRKR